MERRHDQHPHKYKAMAVRLLIAALVTMAFTTATLASGSGAVAYHDAGAPSVRGEAG